MWNVKVRRGSIWSVKNYNQYENLNYQGMTLNTSYVLILSSYINTDNTFKFTYLKVSYRKKPNKNYITINLNNDTMYVDIEFLYTGDQRALEFYQGSLNYNLVNDIVTQTKEYFNLKRSNETKLIKPLIQRNNLITNNTNNTNNTNSKVEKIHKFGINIFVTESKHIHITKSKRLVLSDKLKQDIINNTKTEDDIKVLCNKYNIFPVKAIKEIKNRLVYQNKQKER